MSWKLPIIVHLVGGLKDFFQPSMGYASESLDTEIYASFLEEILLNDTSSMSNFNREYVKKNTLTSVVYKKLMKIFQA